MTDDLGRRIDDAVTPPSAIHIDLDGVIDGERRRRRTMGVFGGAAAVAVVAVGALVGSSLIAPTPSETAPPGVAADQPGEFPDEPPVDAPFADYMWDSWQGEVPAADEYDAAFWALFEERWPDAELDPSDPSLEGHPDTLAGTPGIQGRDETLTKWEDGPADNDPAYTRKALSLTATYDPGDGSWGFGAMRMFFGRDISDSIGVDVYTAGDFTVGDGSAFDLAFCDESGDVTGWPHECTFETAVTESGLTYAVTTSAGFNESIGKVGSKSIAVIVLREDGSAVVVSDGVAGKPGAEDLVPDEDVEDVEPFMSVEDLLAIAEALPMTPVS